MDTMEGSLYYLSVRGHITTSSYRHVVMTRARSNLEDTRFRDPRIRQSRPPCKEGRISNLNLLPVSVYITATGSGQGGHLSLGGPMHR